jgi:quinol monooxygenase YgiN
VFLRRAAETGGEKAHLSNEASYGTEEISMVKYALYVRLKAKAGKEKEVVAFLKSALPLVEAEPGTKAWFALHEDGEGAYSIFDVFDDEAGREAHLKGEVAKALFAKADELLAEAPQIHKVDVLAAKM